MIDFDVLAKSLSLILSWEVNASRFGGIVRGMFLDVTSGVTRIMAGVIAHSP